MDRDGGRESESPSPPPKSSPPHGRDREVGLGSRRVLVVKKDFSSRESSPEPQISISNDRPKAGKGLKKSLHLRLGLPVEPSSKRSSTKSPRSKSPRSARMEITDDDIMAEIIRQKEKKLRKIKKKEKKLKKEKKSSKKRVVVKELHSSEEDTPSEDEDLKKSDSATNLLNDDSDEELYKFFEDNLTPEVEKKPKLGKKGDKKKKEKRGEGKGLNLGLGKSETEGEENLDILEKMKKKNDRRLKRLKEIERDKQLFA